MVQSGLKKCFPQQKLTIGSEESPADFDVGEDLEVTDGAGDNYLNVSGKATLNNKLWLQGAEIESTCDDDFIGSGTLQGLEIVATGDLTVNDDGVIDDKLSVGTGTVNHAPKLHVRDGTATHPPWMTWADLVVIEDDDFAIEQLCTGNYGVAWLQFSDDERCRGGIGYRFYWTDPVPAHEELAMITGGKVHLRIRGNGTITYTPEDELPGVTGYALGVSTTSGGTRVIGKYTASSIRYKENVRDVQDADTSYIYALRPVMFDYKAALKGTNQCGLIAEEVELVAPELVTYRSEITYPEPQPGQTAEDIDPIVTETNEPDTVRYSQLIGPILAEVQKLDAEFDALEQEIAEINAR